MNSKWNRFLILYSLYYKHYTGKTCFHNTDAIIWEDDLRFANKQLLIGEIIYLRNHGLVKGIGGNSYPTTIAIESKGIDVIERILRQYLQYLKDRGDKESQYEYNHISAYSNDIERVSQLYTYIKKRR